MTHRADLESARERMAHKLLQVWPSLSREECFMEELVFVAFNSKKTVPEMQLEATRKLRLMKGLLNTFELEARFILLQLLREE